MEGELWTELPVDTLERAKGREEMSNNAGTEPSGWGGIRPAIGKYAATSCCATKQQKRFKLVT